MYNVSSNTSKSMNHHALISSIQMPAITPIPLVLRHRIRVIRATQKTTLHTALSRTIFSTHNVTSGNQCAIFA